MKVAFNSIGQLDAKEQKEHTTTKNHNQKPIKMTTNEPLKQMVNKQHLIQMTNSKPLIQTTDNKHLVQMLELQITKEE